MRDNRYHVQHITGSKAFAYGQQIAACRGSINRLMSEVMEGHIRFHLVELGAGLKEDPSSEILVACDGAYLGAIHIADTKESVAALHALGLRTVLLTGDAKPVAESIAKEVGIDIVHADVLPDQKSELIRQLGGSARKVAMVGDGISDAPALMQATVGIAMGSGTEVARESAKIMLIGNNLLRLVETIKISRRCHRIVMQNFSGTLAVDSVGVGLAAFIHVASELTFILNSARILSGKRGEKRLRKS